MMRTQGLSAILRRLKEEVRLVGAI
jgi:hypothetical protein